MTSGLVEAWRMSNEANLFVLSKIPAAALGDAYGARTRTVAKQFAHMHAVRLRWLQHSSPRFAESVDALDRDATLGKGVLKTALRASGKAVEGYLAECGQTGRVKSWKGSPATFLSYLVAHEAHHRGLAMVAMRAAGRKLPEELVYGQWDWGKRQTRRR